VGFSPALPSLCHRPVEAGITVSADGDGHAIEPTDLAGLGVDEAVATPMARGHSSGVQDDHFGLGFCFCFPFALPLASRSASRCFGFPFRLLP
jgi:hypothetical protein